MRAAPGGGQEWPLQVDTRDLAGLHERHQRGDLLGHIRNSSRDQAGQTGRRAVPTVKFDRRRRIVDKRRAATSVHVHVDEARRDEAPAEVFPEPRVLAEGHNAALLDLEPSTADAVDTDQPRIGEDHPHEGTDGPQ
jgi:hypothetical protein